MVFLFLFFYDIPNLIRVRQLLVQSIKGCYHAAIYLNYTSFSFISHITRKCFSSCALWYSSPLSCQAAIGESIKDYNNVASFFNSSRLRDVCLRHKKKNMAWRLFGASHHLNQCSFLSIPPLQWNGILDANGLNQTNIVENDAWGIAVTLS